MKLIEDNLRENLDDVGFRDDYLDKTPKTWFIEEEIRKLDFIKVKFFCSAKACNHSTSGGRGGWIMRSRDRDHPGQHGETPSLLKIQKISWAWGHMPAIPATQEAEAGELPEPRRWRLQWAEIMPLHSSLGNKSETRSQKRKRKKKKKKKIYMWLVHI